MDVYIENKKFWNHIVYSFETIFRCIHEYGNFFYPVDNNISLKNDSIYYGNNAPENFKGIIIEEGILFSEYYLTKECIPNCPLQRYQDIPVLFLNKKRNTGSISERKTAENKF